MAVLNKIPPSTTGLELAFTAASVGGDSFHNTGAERAVFKNTSGSPQTVTFAHQQPDNFGYNSTGIDRVVVIPAGAVAFVIGPFAPGQFNDVNSRVQMTYTGVTGISVAIMA